LEPGTCAFVGPTRGPRRCAWGWHTGAAWWAAMKWDCTTDVCHQLKRCSQVPHNCPHNAHNCFMDVFRQLKRCSQCCVHCIHPSACLCGLLIGSMHFRGSTGHQRQYGVVLKQLYTVISALPHSLDLCACCLWLSPCRYPAHLLRPQVRRAARVLPRWSTCTHGTHWRHHLWHGGKWVQWHSQSWQGACIIVPACCLH
jgi:hypothetical protein